MVRPTRLLAALALLTVLGVAGAATAAGAGSGHPPARGAVAAAATAAPLVKKLKTQAFGTVLVTRGGQALYYWTPEKRKPGTIKCTGDCVKAWPVLTVPKGTVVPRKISGFSGTFGTIRRPNGTLQLTYNRLPLYTYAHEGPGQVLCNDVNGWFVVRA